MLADFPAVSSPEWLALARERLCQMLEPSPGVGPRVVGPLAERGPDWEDDAYWPAATMALVWVIPSCGGG